MTLPAFTALLLLLLASPEAARASDADTDGRRSAPALAIEHGKAGTADATPVEPGAAEVEVGYSPSWMHGGGSGGFDVGDEGHLHAGCATLTYGVAAGVDVNVGVGFASLHDPSSRRGDPRAPDRGAGLGDVAIGARWRFAELPEEGLEVAVLAGAVLPTGTRTSATTLGISQEYWSGRAALVLTKDLGRATSNLEVGLGAPLAGDAQGLRALLRANAAVGVQVFSWLQPEVELNYQAAFGASSQVLAATAAIVAPFGGGQRIVAAVQQDVWALHAGPHTTALFAYKTAL